MKQLSLFIPGLLGPLPELENSSIDLASCESLRLWLTRGVKRSVQSKNYYEQLAELFGIEFNYSMTKVSALADDCDCSQDFWYRADPVHFKTDIDHAILLDQHQLDVQQEEADQLVASFNQHFIEDGLELFAPHPHRWYLRANKMFKLQTICPMDAVGRDIKHFLPEGEHALEWRRLLNEAQMLFHSHEINEKRIAVGGLSINSLWLWGEEQAINQLDSPGWNWVMADDAVARGMALLNHIKLLSVSNSKESIMNLPGNGLIIIDDVLGPLSYGDVSAWQEAVEKICEIWIMPVYNMLKKRQLDQVSLYTGEGRVFDLTPGKQKKIWLRARPLKQFVNTHA